MNVDTNQTRLRACTFCGHHDASSAIKPALYSAIETLITDNGVTEFYVGNQGSFDYMVADTLNALKKLYPRINAFVVLAYMPGEKNKFELEEKLDTMYPDGLEGVPRRYAITHRNRWMVSNSDYLVSAVSHGWGGAAQTLKYAQTKKLVIITI